MVVKSSEFLNAVVTEFPQLGDLIEIAQAPAMATPRDLVEIDVTNPVVGAFNSAP